MATDRLINSTQGDSIITKLDDIKTAINNQSAAATEAPLMDGTATVGTSTKYARENHVHPTDTSRAANVMSTYAVDTTRENITTSSTVQGAIEQLEYREELNKNNILSVADQSTKYNIAQGRARTLDSVTSTVSGYTITFSGTSSGTRSFSFLEPFSPPKSGDYVWKYTNGVTIGGTPISVYMWDTTANVGVNATDIEGGLKVNLNSTHLYTLAFTLQNNAVVSGNYSVMIISKDLWDKGFTDFQPYALSNAELTAKEQVNENNILSLNNYGGGRNFINISAIKSLNTTGTWSGNKYTATTGIEFTVNSDNSVTVNGTSSGAPTTFMLTSHGAADTDLSANTYKLSGCEGGSSTTYDLRFYRNSDGSNIVNYNGDTNVAYTSGAYNISILVRAGQTLTNKVFRPMLRLSSDESNLYQPYAMSNAEITAWILAHS